MTGDVAVTQADDRLSIDPGSPAYEAARSQVVEMLRDVATDNPDSGYDKMADDLENGDLMEVPTWIALQANAAIRALMQRGGK